MMTFPKPELYTVECKNFTAISTAPFYIGPSTPRPDKKGQNMYFAFNKPGSIWEVPNGDILRHLAFRYPYIYSIDTKAIQK